MWIAGANYFRTLINDKTALFRIASPLKPSAPRWQELDTQDYNPNRKRRPEPARLFDNRIHHSSLNRAMNAGAALAFIVGLRSSTLKWLHTCAEKQKIQNEPRTVRSNKKWPRTDVLRPSAAPEKSLLFCCGLTARALRPHHPTRSIR